LKRSDEIGLVARTLDHMAAELQRRMAVESRERERLATLLAVMSDGVVAISARQSIAYLNAVAARLLATDGTAAIGRPFREAIGLLSLRQWIEDSFADGKPARHEARLTAHPHDQVLRIEITPLRDADGGPFGILLVLHDLTELRRLEEMRRTFASNVSHELKTPLTAIGSLVDALLEDREMAPSLRQRFLERIRHQNERLDHLVRDLLMISRLESDRATLEVGPVSLVPLVADCVQTFTDVARQKGIQLCLAVSRRTYPRPGARRGDPSDRQQSPAQCRHVHALGRRGGNPSHVRRRLGESRGQGYRDRHRPGTP
jgi:two-component system phosphate regulon sensor histidine kinase PhoR